MLDAFLVATWVAAVYLTHALLSLAKLGRKTSSGVPAAVVATSPSAVQTPIPGVAVGDRQPAPTAVLKVSPRHEVALSLAFQGFDLSDIARRCDITVAEAKLVATLAESYQSLAHTAEERHGRRTRAAA